VDDCASEHTCTASHPYDESCPEPFFDATVAISAMAPDGTFTMQLDLGGDFEPLTCPGGTQDVCFDDGENTWCSPRSVATCASWEHVIVSGAYVEFRAGTSVSGCNNVWSGTVVP